MSHPQWFAYVIVVAMSLLVSVFQPVDVPPHAPQGSVEALQVASLALIR